MKQIILLLAASCSFCWNLHGSYLLTAGGPPLRVDFTTHPENWGELTPHYLRGEIGPGSFDPPARYDVFFIQVFDGNTLLGSQTGLQGLTGPILDDFLGIGGIPFFESSTSPGGVPPFGSVIDFSSILDGTIDGHLLISVTSGSVQFDSFSLGLWHRDTDTSSLSREGWISYTVTPVPEPTSVQLVLLGVGALPVWYFRRRTRSKG